MSMIPMAAARLLPYAAKAPVLGTMLSGAAKVGTGILAGMGIEDLFRAVTGGGNGQPTAPGLPVMTGSPMVAQGPGGAMMTQGAPVGGATDRLGRPMMVEAQYTTKIKCPPGYVAVTLPTGARVCALKGPARAAGLYRGRRKPPISAGDWRTLQKSDRAIRKVSRIAKMTQRVAKKKKAVVRPKRRRTT